jgi:transcriptional regulator with XRE-family HTH domain
MEPTSFDRHEPDRSGS